MAAKQPLSRIVELAAIISESVTTLQAELSAKGLPSFSFDEDACFPLVNESSHSQDAILDATAELHDLLLDPMILIRDHGGVQKLSLPESPSLIHTC